jgi:hypothetical protein
MFTVSELNNPGRRASDESFGLSTRAAGIERMIDLINLKALVLKEDILHDPKNSGIPKDKLTDQGIVALARVFVFNPNAYADISEQVLGNLRTSRILSLSPATVHSAWIHHDIQEERTRGPISAKLFVLGHLITSYDMGNVHPFLTHEELYELLNMQAKRRTPSVKLVYPDIPKYSFVIQKRYDDPPYMMLKAQLQLMDPRDKVTFDVVGRLIDRKWTGKTKWKDLSSETRLRMAEKLAEYWKSGTPLPHLGHK